MPVMFVAIQLIIQMCTSLLRSRLNLALQVSQGSASTCFRWSGHFRHSFVTGLFRNTPSNFYWNRFIFDRQGAKNKLAQFFFETRCSLQLQCEEKLPRSVWQMSWAVHRYNFSGRRAVTDSEALQM